MPFPAMPAAEVLEGELVRLEPLAHRHAAGLAAAADEDRSTYRHTWVPAPAEVPGYLTTQLASADAGFLRPYAQIRVADGRVVGVTAFRDPRWWPGRDELGAVEVGATWLAASAQGTGLNAEAKLLLFTHAFETWRVARVDLHTDARNAVSRRAIERTGARFEGVLRSWSRSWAPGEAGLPRDSAMYSIVAAEWPARRDALRARVSGAVDRARGGGQPGAAAAPAQGDELGGDAHGRPLGHPGAGVQSER